MASKDADPDRVGEHLAHDDRGRRWMPPARPVIAGLLGVEAVVATTFVIWPPTAQIRPTNAVIAIVLAVAAVGCAMRPAHRGPPWFVEAWIVVAWALPLVVIATRRTEASQLLWAAILILVAVLTAFYLPARRAAYQVAVMIVGYVVAAMGFDPPTRPLFVFGFIVCIVVCTFAVAVMRRDRDRVRAELEALATTDPLTGVLNRRGLDLKAGAVRANAARAGRPSIIALFDLDELKSLNDTEGHDAGDATIRDVADHWRDDLREGDVLARVGGDEFVIVLPNADESAAAALLTRLRDDAPYPCSQGWTLWGEGESLDDAIERADALMYAEKSERKGEKSGQDYGRPAPEPTTHYPRSPRRRHSRHSFGDRLNRKH